MSLPDWDFYSADQIPKERFLYFLAEWDGLWWYQEDTRDAKEDAQEVLAQVWAQSHTCARCRKVLAYPDMKGPGHSWSCPLWKQQMQGTNPV